LSITLERSGNPLRELPIMSIENPVIYVPIRHLATDHWHLATVFVSLHLSRVPYKSAHFMQNKPNLLAVSKMLKMNITSAITVNYINELRTTNYELIMKNKPNQTQFQTPGICLLSSIIRPLSSVLRPLFPDEAQNVESFTQKQFDSRTGFAKMLHFE
jgi:hypothetical protein